MARVVQVAVPARVRHPWSDWADGQTWELAQGEDFTGDLDVFRHSAHRWARKNGYQLVTRINREDNTITLQFSKRKTA